MTNIGSAPIDFKVLFSDLGIEGKANVRDVWERKDLGQFEKEYAFKVASHGTQLVTI